ncbi:hypothetical protein JCM1841_005534 [Sporobolomyces salmonicolor]
MKATSTLSLSPPTRHSSNQEPRTASLERARPRLRRRVSARSRPFALSPSLSHLESLLGPGHYIDQNGTRWTPTNALNSTLDRSLHAWQPDEGCELRRYSQDEILECLAGERAVVWGDSTARVAYYGMVNKLSPTSVTDKHQNRVLSFPVPSTHANVTLDFRWDPVLNINNYNRFTSYLASPSDLPSDVHDPWSGSSELPIAMVIMVGLWYTDSRPGMHPEEGIPEWKGWIERILEAAEQRKLVKEVLIVPEVEVPTERDDDEVHSKKAVREMNRWLRERFETWRSEGRQARANTRVVFASGFNSLLLNFASDTPDGLHYSMPVAETQADLLLNAICGSRLEGLPVNACGRAGAIEGGPWKLPEAGWIIPVSPPLTPSLKVP